MARVAGGRFKPLVRANTAAERFFAFAGITALIPDAET